MTEKRPKITKYITTWVVDFENFKTDTELYRPQRIVPRKGQDPDEAAMEYMKLVDQFIEGPAKKADHLDVMRDSELRAEIIEEAKAIREKMAELTGMRVCKASDCLRYIPEGSKALYCPEGGCRRRESSKRQRKRDPRAIDRARLKYLKFCEGEGDLDE